MRADTTSASGVGTAANAGDGAASRYVYYNNCIATQANIPGHAKPTPTIPGIVHARDRTEHAQEAQRRRRQRIRAETRRAAQGPGITQTALANEIGISQRMMAYYEGPTAHPPANRLPAMATALGVTVDTLLGIEVSKRRAKATDTRFERRLRQLEKLNAANKRQVLQLM